MSAEQSRALDRLAHSRAALVDRMRGKRPAAEGPQANSAASTVQSAPGDEAHGTEKKGGTWSLAKHVAGIWWRRHPASVAAELAQPAMAHYARERPLKLIGYAAVAGAAIVVLKPWRLVPVTALLAMLLKTSDLASVAAAMISPRRTSPDTPHKENP